MVKVTDDKTLADMAKQQIRYEGQLQSGDDVFVCWTYMGRPYSGMAMVDRVFKNTIRIVLTENVSTGEDHGGWHRGSHLIIPRFGFVSWSLRNMVMVPETFE